MDDSCRSDENEVYNNIDTTGNRTVCREENMARAQEDSVAPKKKKRVSKKHTQCYTGEHQVMKVF
jgi:hypothetical protein